VTPLHSIFRELLLRAETGDTEGTGSIEEVKLVWSSRSDAQLCLFADTWARAAALETRPPGQGAHVRFELLLYNTARAAVPSDTTSGPSLAEVMRAMPPMHQTHGAGTVAFGGGGGGIASTQDVSAALGSVRGGRPDLQHLLASMADPTDGSFSHTMAMVCGPPRLVDEVSDLCFTHDIDFHTEVFNF
jgi:hypothetical protein